MTLPYILIAAGVLLLCCFPFLFPKFNRHKHKIQKASVILEKIRAFEGEAVEARIFGYLRKIDPYVFEELLLTAFEQKGYKIIRNKKYSGDGGIDGRLIDNKGRLIYVQAKRYKGHIKKSDVLDFSTKVIRDKKCYRGYFVHTGRTGKSLLHSNEFVDVYSGNKLIELLKY